MHAQNKVFAPLWSGIKCPENLDIIELNTVTEKNALATCWFYSGRQRRRIKLSIHTITLRWAANLKKPASNAHFKKSSPSLFVMFMSRN